MILQGYIVFNGSTGNITGQYSNCKKKGRKKLKGLRGITVNRTIPSTQGRYTITAFTPFELEENQQPVIVVQTLNTSGSIVLANVVSTNIAFQPSYPDYDYQITIVLETQSVCGGCSFINPTSVMVYVTMDNQVNDCESGASFGYDPARCELAGGVWYEHADGYKECCFE
jgi:hypothetical protein